MPVVPDAATAEPAPLEVSKSGVAALELDVKACVCDDSLALVGTPTGQEIVCAATVLLDPVNVCAATVELLPVKVWAATVLLEPVKVCAATVELLPVKVCADTVPAVPVNVGAVAA